LDTVQFFNVLPALLQLLVHRVAFLCHIICKQKDAAQQQDSANLPPSLQAVTHP
jgi:hypothetical protein